MGLERNVDVLVQVLQSDEPEEVAVIKVVLIQHLELDSKVTLGVLCDQIVPPKDPMEDGDKTIRERLEALVVAFLAQDTRKPLLAQLQGQRRGAAKQEGALIDTLIKVLGAISPSFLLGTDAFTGSIQILCRGCGEDHRSHPRLPALISTTDGQHGARTNWCSYYSRAPPQRSGRTSPLDGTRRTWSSPACTLSCRTFYTAQKAPRIRRSSCASTVRPLSTGK
ncbi:hypothetical protein EDB85DRAFT_236475 [Lactarius pseudohatsudake]|nr:hypothetical protein EDB85DRAFT_236475 [Lactarius pseudohatsudake]